jgi:hypothetical protein
MAEGDFATRPGGCASAQQDLRWYPQPGYGSLILMRRPVTVLILCLLAGLLAWSGLRDNSSAASAEPAPSETDAAPSSGPAKTRTATPPPSRQEPLITTAAPPAPPVGNRPRLDDSKSGPRFKRAYMLSLDQGRLTLVDQQDIEGDFAPKRRKPEEWSGMLRCRLMSADNQILAEELLPAPDHLCAVLDPQTGGSKPVNYTVAGPVVFQVRMPRVKGAVRLDISRIIQPGDTPLEGSLGSIPLPSP